MPQGYPRQLIIFGPPGTGKSYYIRNQIAKNINAKEPYYEVTFHPSTKYGDFVGKIHPKTDNGDVVYKYMMGVFLKALAEAYCNADKNILLIIDEM